MFVKGVSTIRSENEDQVDYQRVTAMEKFGIRQYVHKYEMGY